MPADLNSGKAFDPSDPGTPEALWLQLLECAPEWSPRAGPLIVVAPHPDDEVLGAGGLIQACAAAGHPVTIVSVTDGEASDPTHIHLDLVRRKELQDALRVLTAVHVHIQRTGIPDGKVAAHEYRLRGVIEEYATPDATIVAPYEHDGHPDHEAVGRVCREVARAAHVPLVSYPVWTWHHTQPTSLKSLQWGRFSLTAAARRAKARALQCFKSQLQPASGPPIVPAHVLTYFQRSYEAFVL